MKTALAVRISGDSAHSANRGEQVGLCRVSSRCEWHTDAFLPPAPPVLCRQLIDAQLTVSDHRGPLRWQSPG